MAERKTRRSRKKKEGVVNEPPAPEVTTVAVNEPQENVDVKLVKDLIKGGQRYKAGTVVEVKKRLADTLIKMGSAVAVADAVEEAPVEKPAVEETTDETNELVDDNE